MTYKTPTLPLPFDIETKAILRKTTQASRALGELNGITKLIPNPQILINSLTLQEAKESSAIENIITTHDELYQADIKVWITSKQAKEVQDYKDALLMWYQTVKDNHMLLINDIIRIQEMIEHNQAWIRNQPGTSLKNESTWRTIYTPPQWLPEIKLLMENLELYINSQDQVDPLIKLAVIHHQFESIHPFFDGNGRTWRIINILYLILHEVLDIPVLYLSGYILATKSTYYILLQKVRDEWSWEERILYMLEWVIVTANATTSIVKDIRKLLWETKTLLKWHVSFYSKDLLEVLYKHPYTKIDFIVRELNVTRQTASKYLNTLVEYGVMNMIQIWNDKYYINTKLYALLRKWIDYTWSR